MSHEDAASTASVERTPEKDTRFFGQPWALTHIFGVELWERFSFYGMQGILLIYMYYTVADGGLAIDRGIATGIVGAYGGSVYLATVLGAWLADRLYGSERVLFASAFVIMAGHIALALLPGFVGLGVGLVLVALGSGGLKATATSVVGTLYAADDIRRDSGFSLFYLGINLGGFAGPLLTGLLQTTLGFHWGFGLAAVGMAAGLVQYSIGRRHLPEAARRVPNPLPKKRMPLVWIIAGAGAALIAVLALTGVIRADNLAVIVIAATVVAAVAYFIVILRSPVITAEERSRVWGFVPLFLTSVAFWSLYQQQFTVVTIYSAERLDRDLFGWEMPVSWVQSINPVFIILLSGVFAAAWTRLGRRQPSTPVKFAIGAIVMGAAFLLFLPFAGTGANGTPLVAIIGILLVFTIAELFLSPVGLSAATKLAPQRFTTQMVALFFLSVALGTAVAGQAATFYDPADEAPYFTVLGIIAIAVGVGLAFSAKPVLRLMRGVR